MKKSLIVALATVSALSLTPSAALAGPILTDLPSNTYITIGDLDWTWAAPVSSVNFSGNVLSGPELHGWRFATVDEWASRPNGNAFYVDGSWVQSAAYWNSNFTHIDISNGTGSEVNRVMVGDNSGTAYFEMWYVRDSSISGAVPEPTTWAMMIGGLALMGTVLRRSRTEVSFA